MTTTQTVPVPQNKVQMTHLQKSGKWIDCPSHSCTRSGPRVDRAQHTVPCERIK